MTRIGPYSVIRTLGAGGMGQVFLAASPGNRLVAVKVIHEHLLADPLLRERFRAELKAARAVSAAFTAPIVDADPDAERPWLATAYIDASSLAHLVHRGGPLAASQVLRLAAGLAEALKSMHDAGVSHRDLKPSNILAAADGPKLIDFGIARIAESERLTAAGIIVGTPGYIAPEILRGQAPTPAVDVFALGAVLYHAAAGHHLYGSGDHRTVNRRVLNDTPDLSEITDPVLRTLIADCLAPDPRARPTPAAILARLGPAPTPTLSYTSAIGTSGGGRLFGLRRRTVLAVGGCVAAIAMAITLTAVLWPAGSAVIPPHTAAAPPLFPWSVPEGQATFTGMWSTPTEVVLGTSAGLTAYSPDDGRKLWTWSPPAHGMVCEMSGTVSNGIGAVSYGTWSGTSVQCTSLQTVSVSIGQSAWKSAVSLAAPGTGNAPAGAGGRALSVADGVVTAPYAGQSNPLGGQGSATDLISVSADSGIVRWSTDFGPNAMPDGCTLTGLAQAFAGAVYTVGVCNGTATLLSLGGPQPTAAATVATLPGCVTMIDGIDFGFMVSDAGYLLIDCGPAGVDPALYVLAPGSKTPTSLELSGADAQFVGEAAGGVTWPSGFVVAGRTLYLYTSVQSGALGGGNGVIAIDMTTGKRLWTHTFDQATMVTILTADGGGVTVAAGTTAAANVVTLSAATGAPSVDYALTDAQTALFSTVQGNVIPPFALEAGSKIAIAFPDNLSTSTPLLGVLPKATSAGAGY
ncbi:serine/threonine-protein kinase [Catenulispora pinisilvae]|uniref:serine/threonine-protein kinase n=1 Tax=Catenulispora pinisilvae TaxID=2705253 RepID=UPI001891DE65|nr:serine/threonine-protein kinase [Catenulispora pinisilvae]